MSCVILVRADVRRRMSPPHRQSVVRISEELQEELKRKYKALAEAAALL
jgi:hypothetical protein